MERVIIYDNDHVFTSDISSKIKDDLHGIYVDIFSDLKALRDALIKNVDQYIFALIDISSEDDMCDTVIKVITSQYIPMIVLTNKEYLKYRDNIITNYPIIDFLVKDQKKNFHYVSSLINQMKNARDIDILLVSDSQHDRDYIYNNLLVRYPFDIIDAKNIDEVAEALEQNPNIRIMIIDIKPTSKGLDLVEEIRGYEQKESLAIMAITSKDDSYTSARYLQVGANDFVTKPVQFETFHSRMNVMIETLSLFDKLQKIANVDYLTELYNRRYFFESGNMLFSNAKRRNISIATAMLDIDHFKSINDTYGHNTGDIVLKEIAYLLKQSFRNSDLIARVGGEEFAAILVDADEKTVLNIFETLRKKVENLEIESDNEIIKVTISIGITLQIGNILESTINIADQNLYEAKETGRNKIIIN